MPHSNYVETWGHLRPKMHPGGAVQNVGAYADFVVEVDGEPQRLLLRFGSLQSAAAWLQHDRNKTASHWDLESGRSTYQPLKFRSAVGKGRRGTLVDGRPLSVEERERLRS